MKDSNAILGRLYNREFFGSFPSDMTNNTTGSTTTTYTSGRPSVAGGSGLATNFTERFTWLNGKLSGFLFEQDFFFIPTVAGLGTFIQWAVTPNSSSTFNALFNTTTGVITICSETGSVLATSSALTGWSLGDLIRLNFKRDTLNNTLTATAQAMKSGGLSVTATYGDPEVRDVQPSIGFISGTTTVYQSYFNSSLSKNSRGIIVGDSNSYALSSSDFRVSSWPFLFRNSCSNDVDAYTYPGMTTTSLLDTIDTVCLSRPKYFLLMLGTNDLGISSSQYSANMTIIINKMLATGAKVFLGQIFPRTGFGSSYNAYRTVVTSFVDNVNVFLIDGFTSSLNDGTGQLNATYSLDGTHLNASGNSYYWLSIVKPVVSKYFNV